MTDFAPLTSAELADLKLRAKAATPGPWCVIDEMLMQDYGENDLVADGRYWHFERNKVDLAYVAAANPETILRLIDMVERRNKALLEIRSINSCTDSKNAARSEILRITSEALAATEPPNG